MIGLLGTGLSKGGWQSIKKYLDKADLRYRILKDHSSINTSFDVVFSFGYNRIVPPNLFNKAKNGFIVFHSTDLPKGRGWAPLFYTLVNKEKRITLSMIYADEKVDSGNIIAKAYYPIETSLTIEEARLIDDFLVMALFKKFVKKVVKSKIFSIAQKENEATYYQRRKPSDSLINVNKKISEVVTTILAIPDEFSPFFVWQGRKFNVKLKPAEKYKIQKSKLIIKSAKEL